MKGNIKFFLNFVMETQGLKILCYTPLMYYIFRKLWLLYQSNLVRLSLYVLYLGNYDHILEHIFKYLNGTHLACLQKVFLYYICLYKLFYNFLNKIRITSWPTDLPRPVHLPGREVLEQPHHSGKVLKGQQRDFVGLILWTNKYITPLVFLYFRDL